MSKAYINLNDSRIFQTQSENTDTVRGNSTVAESVRINGSLLTDEQVKQILSTDAKEKETNPSATD